MAGISPEGIWTSTSDTSWSLIALTEYFSGGKSDPRPATVHGEAERQGNRGLHDRARQLPHGGLDPKEFLKNPSVPLHRPRTRRFLYKLALTFPRTDYAKSGYSNGFEIHKTIKNTDNTNVIKVGDIVEVKLKINIKNHAPNYVVLDDPLPAGFVAINSAIKTEEAGIAKKKMKRMMRQDDEDGEESGEIGRRVRGRLRLVRLLLGPLRLLPVYAELSSRSGTTGSWPSVIAPGTASMNTPTMPGRSAKASS